MEKRLTMFLACLFLSLGMALAQNKVSGTVVSADDGEPIVGASVLIQGTKTGTVTNIDGEFSLNVPEGKKIVVTYIGMKSQVVAAKANMKISLHPDDKTLGEVVVTGMTQMDKRLFSGATTKVSAADARSTVWPISAVPSKVVQPVSAYRTSPVPLVQHRRFVFVEPPQFTVVQNHYGLLMASSWKTYKK